MGELAMRTLMERLSGTCGSQRLQILAPELIVRRSTAPLPG
jgi:DNA-binding LacI/PurR family transcriptional regulator